LTLEAAGDSVHRDIASLEIERMLTYYEYMLTSKEGIMHIHKALFVYLLLESLAETEEWVIDWRWLSDLS
jgi:hypothetical protein